MCPTFRPSGPPTLGCQKVTGQACQLPKEGQNITKMLVVTKNNQPQGPSGKEVSASATSCKNQQGTLVGMPWQDFGRQGQCSKPGGLPGGCHLDLCIFGGWAAFHGNFLLWAANMCHLANVLAPKVGCALKCAAWAGDPTPKKHPKANSGLWSMGLEMANSVAIATDDKFIKFIKNVQKKCNRPMNAPKIICCNHMQPHACASGHPKALLKFSTFDSESASCASESAGLHGPHGLEACLAICVGPRWPELAKTGKHMLGVAAGTCGRLAMHLVAHCQLVLAC